MSIQMVGWVLDQDVSDPIGKLCLISIANAHNNTTGQCNPSYSVIAKEASCSRRTAIRKVEWLENNGYIRSLENKKGAVNGSNSYRINTEFGGDTETLWGGDSLSLGSDTCDTRGGDTAVTHKEPEIRTRNICAFEEFWDAFNHKKGKEAALKVWNRKKLNLKASEVIQGAKAYAKTRSPDQKYWKHPQGWLNDGRWEDFAPSTKSNEINWQARIDAWVQSKIWLPDWGSSPDMAGCRAPKELIKTLEAQNV